MSIENVAQRLGLPREKAYRCNGCDEIVDVSTYEPVTLYECGECGTKFTREDSADGASHRCPDCNRFSPKSTDLGCPHCGEDELFEVTVVTCPWCDEPIIADDFDSHITCEG